VVARGDGPRGRGTPGPRGGVAVPGGGRFLGRLGAWARGPLTGMRTPGQDEGQGRGASQPEERAGAGGAVPAPFIVGAERSGTTLLRLMLDAHPELAIPPETHFIERAAEACEGAPDPRRAFLETVTSHRRWGDFRIEGERLAERVSGIEPFDLGEALRAFYGVYAGRFGKPRWGDKTPNYVRRMSLIHGLLPEARFVHIIRDGRDVALSTRDLWFGPDSVEEAARRWRSLIEDARRQSEGLPHYLEVRYEDLVSDAESALGVIGAFIELPWDPGMLDYHTTADERLKEIHRDIETPKGKKVVRGEMRKSLHTLTGKPPQRDRIARWREEMGEADLRCFEEVAGGTLRELGYEVG
jgi:hypothetical protein